MMYSSMAAGVCAPWTFLLITWTALALVKSNPVPGLGEDNTARDSSSLLKLRLIETRLEKRAAQETSGEAAVKAKIPYRHPVLAPRRHDGDDDRKRDISDAQDGNSETQLNLLSRQYRDTQGAIDTFYQRYTDFWNVVKPFVSGVRTKFLSGTPDVVLGVQKIPNLLTTDDISFQTRDSSKIMMKFSFVYQILQLVNAKLVNFIRTDSISSYNQDLNIVMYRLNRCNLAASGLAFAQEDQISILAGGVSGVNQGVQAGADKASLEAAYKLAQFLVTVPDG